MNQCKTKAQADLMRQEYNKRMELERKSLQLRYDTYENSPKSHADYNLYSQRFNVIRKRTRNYPSWNSYWRNIMDDNFHREVSEMKRMVWRNVQQIFTNRTPSNSELRAKNESKNVSVSQTPALTTPQVQSQTQGGMVVVHQTNVVNQSLAQHNDIPPNPNVAFLGNNTIIAVRMNHKSIESVCPHTIAFFRHNYVQSVRNRVNRKHRCKRGKRISARTAHERSPILWYMRDMAKR